MKVLVVGGAGYIGSHMVKVLLEHGHEPVTLDNLSRGYRDAVVGGEFVDGDMADRSCLDQLFAANHFDGVMHFAAHSIVGESVREPALYYRNNLASSLNLLEAMLAHDVRRFIFSSTASVFGEPEYLPIDEEHPRRPINPYGFSKLALERVLEDYDRAYGLRSVSLRYFNAAGADPEGRIGERHDPETHLIPLVLQVASGRREAAHVFGTDYDTPDGTCIRDYIHIVDLCSAHLLALDRLQHGSASMAFNLGNGSGFSVRQVIDAVGRVSGKPIKCVEAARRPGDPARLVADSSRARRELGWMPRFDGLDTIVEHAWRWEQRLVGASAR